MGLCCHILSFSMLKISRATFLSAIGAVCVGNVLQSSTKVILPIKFGRFKSSLYYMSGITWNRRLPDQSLGLLFIDPL